MSGGGYGHVAHADGTAYNMINAHANNGGGFISTVPSTSNSDNGGTTNNITYNDSSTTNYNYGTASGGTTSSATEATQTFEDWVGTLFDWVEVRLERLTDKISNYIQKAENQLNTRSYNQASSSYRSAINNTLTQVGREDEAYLKYMEEVDIVLQKAADAGYVSADSFGVLKDQLAKGELNIEEYSEQMQSVVDELQKW